MTALLDPAQLGLFTSDTVSGILACARDLAQIGKADHRILKTLGDAYGLSIQDRYNAVEAMLVEMISSGEQIEAIQDQINAMPAQTTRSLAKDAHQQFSTPVKHAYAVAKLANLSASDNVLEPSAGTGMLAAYARRVGVASLRINELDPVRLAVAERLLSPEVATSHDAMFIHALLNGVAPTVVLMNPPFSVDAAGRNVGSTAGLRHVAAAVKAAAEGARIVTILGANQHPDICAAWDDILGGLPVRVRAAYTIDGRDYYRFGTVFDSCIVVLDKTAAEMPCVASSTVPMGIDELLASLPTIARCEMKAEHRATVTAIGPRLSKSRAAAWAPQFGASAPVQYVYEAPKLAASQGAFAPFAAHIRVAGANDHAASLVESVALSMVRPPKPSVEVMFPVERIGSLSHEQFEGVVLANASFERTVRPNDMPVTGGFMIGYGTGFGKGRTVAATILSQMVKGYTKAVWFSKTRDLLEDAQRDWSDVAGAENAAALFDLTTIPTNTSISNKHGILFSTYATLRQDAREGTRSRLDQICEWLGEDFAGVVVFDESHELANALPARSDRGKVDPSKQGLAALELQERLPRAKVVYTSATAASKIEAFAYANRLGLWGPGTSFTTREQFLEAMRAGGTGAMELLCRDAKALGSYMAASLTLDGVVCERLEHHLSADEVAAYNEVARAWSIIRASVEATLDDRTGTYSSVARSQLAATSMRSMQALLTSLAMTTVLPDVDRRMDEGYAPVFQVANTYEADQSRALAKVGEGDALDTIDLSSKETIKRYLTDNYPTALLTEVVGSDGESLRWEPVTDANGVPVCDPQAVQARDELLANLDAIIAPDSPLSQLFNTYGDQLAECTGRSRRVVRKIVDNTLRTVVEKRGANASSDDTEAFMNGEKSLLLFSEQAGGVGRSYHADRSAQNQKPRAHYGLQLGWRAENAIQSFGRTHRTNQAQPPTWILVTTDAPGQRRFISSIARRLEALGACTRGQRDASGTALFSADDNLESEYATAAVNALLTSIREKDFPVSYDLWLEYTGVKLIKETTARPINMTVTRFLNQILCCPLDVDPAKSAQHKLMDALVAKMQENIEAAKARGTFDEGVQVLKAQKIEKTRERSIHVDTETGAETFLVDLAVTRPTARHSFGVALTCVKRSRAVHNLGRFVKTPEGIRAVYKVADVSIEGKSEQHYRVLGASGVLDVIGNFPRDYYYLEIDEAAARKLWKAEEESAQDTVTVPLHLVCGTLLPIYHRLPKKRARIYAVTLPDEGRLIGRVLEPDEANELLAPFGEAGQATLEEAVEHVRRGGAAILSRRLRLKRSLYEGRYRIEVTADGTMLRAAALRAEAAGIEVVRVGYALRWFLPEHAPVDALLTFEQKTDVLNLVAA